MNRVYPYKTYGPDITETFLMLILIILLNTGTVSAFELQVGHPYKPTYSLGVGYNFIRVDGSKRVIEYMEDDDSLVIEGVVAAYPLPHRLHLEVFVYSDDDLYLDTGYSYRDLILSRLVLTEFVHNTDHSLFPATGPSEERRYLDRDRGGEYDEDIKNAVFNLRFKYPGYPFHLFVRYHGYYKNGERQQRYLIGTFGTEMTVNADARRVKYETAEVKFGANGHFGPVEIEYTHGEKNFSPGGETSLSDMYPETGYRPGDVYQHNVIPEFSGSSDFIRIHTSYTGSLVSSATVGNIRHRNTFSGVKRSSLIGAGQISYIPIPELAFFLRYRYRETDEVNSDETTLYGLNSAVTTGVRKATDIKKHELSFDIRSRPFRRFNIAGSFSIADIKRSDTDGWMLLDADTVKKTFSIKAFGRILKGLKLRGQYIFTDNRRPLYNSEPERSHEVRLYGSYTLSSWMTTTLSYKIRWDRNDNLRYFDGGNDVLIEDGERNNTMQHVLFLTSFFPFEKTSFTAGFGFYRNGIRQSLLFSTFAGDGSSNPGLSVMEDGVPYNDESRIYILGVSQKINDRLDLTAGLFHTNTTGRFKTSTEPAGDIGSFSSIKVKDTELSLKLNYGFPAGMGLESIVAYERYTDGIESSNNGSAYRAMILLSKKW